MGLPPIDYARRLKGLREKLGANALLLLSQPTAVRNRDVYHQYRQESFLHYLTGFEEPHCAFLYVPNRPEGQQILMFLRSKDPVAEQWDGRRLGVEAAPDTLSVDIAYPIQEFWEKLPQLLHGHDGLYYQLGLDNQADIQLIEALKGTRRIKPRHVDHLIPIYDAEALAGDLRLIKGPEEIARMKVAADITAKGFSRVLRELKPGLNEKQVQSFLLSEYLYHGADMEAYPGIVAGGKNACILHYVENNATLNDGELLLIDSGCQYQYYASDVTRTLPIGKTFTAPQRDLYQVVLEAQLQSIKLAVPGQSLAKIHEKSRDVLIDGLIDLRILTGSRSKIIEDNSFKKYYPHGTSHWLGMDVHDVGPYMGSDKAPMGRTLEPGMCFTIEPGLYLNAEDKDIPEPFRGIGIRIEDDILVTDRTPDVITAAIPKSVQDLENRRY
jgi:Xaa-Pro aminopeptidase